MARLVPTRSTGSGSPASDVNTIVDWAEDIETGRMVYNVLNYGALGNGSTDDTSAIQTALTACAATGGVLYLPAGYTFLYSALTTLTSNTKPVIISGYGATLLKSGGTGTGLLIQGSGGASGPAGPRRQGPAILGVRFSHNVTQTAGETIKLYNVEHAVVSDIRTESAYGALLLVDTFDVHIRNCYLRASVSYDMKLTGTGSTLSVIDTYINGVLGEGVSGNVTKTGLIVDSGVSGLFVSNVDLTHGACGVQVTNTGTGGSDRAEFLYFSHVYADSVNQSGWLFSADCKTVHLTSCWAATSGDYGIAISAGINFTLVNAMVLNNGLHGVILAGADEHHILGGTFSGNGADTANTYDGIHVNAAVGGFRIQDVRSGNLTGIGSGTQKYGIQIDAGAGNNYTITGNDLRSNTTGALLDGGTGVSKRLHNNLGWNPRGNVTAPSIPATTVAQNNTFGVDMTVYVVGGTVSSISVSGTTTGVTSGAISVPAGGTITLAYTVAPTWKWFGA